MRFIYKILSQFCLILGLSACNSGSTTPSNPGIYDVAVVGAGVAGSYTAYRIKDNFPGQNVAVFEMSNRVGGRLFSYKFPHTNTFAELGGMRIGESQYLVYYLAKNKLKLTLQNTQFKQQLTYFDSVQCNTNLPSGTVCNESFIAVTSKIKAMFPCGAPTVNTANVSAIMTCLQQQQYRGLPLSSYTSLDFYSTAITPSELLTLYQYSGYSVFLSPGVSAVQQITTLYNTQGTYYSVESGMQQIPIQLMNMFKKRGWAFIFNTQVNSINWDSNRKLFVIQASNLLDNSTQTILARKVIWAAGKNALNKESTNFLNNPDSQAQINNVTTPPFTKIWFTYTNFWWSVLGIYRGYTLTDLPLLSTFYFDPLPPQESSNTNALIKVSYNYGSKAAYWESYMGNNSIIYWDGISAYLGNNFNNLVPDPGIAAAVQTTYAPMVADVTNQLSLVHGLSVPNPQAFLMINWNKPPFNGGISTWSPVASIPAASNKISQMNPEVPFYIVGEAWSAYTGWVEGALETSEYVLNSYFGIAQPSWLYH